MDLGQLLLEVTGITAERMLAKAGECQVFGMTIADGGQPKPVSPVDLQAAGLAPFDRESYFTLFKAKAAAGEISGAAIAVEAQIQRAPDKPEERALVVHMEVADIAPTLFIRPFEVVDENIRFSDPFFY